MLFHLLLLIVVPGCWLACWWQATRAESGNFLSWAYAIEWPIFSIIAIVGWWQLIHEDPLEVEARRRGTRAAHYVPELATAEAAITTPSAGTTDSTDATPGRISRRLQVAARDAGDELVVPDLHAWEAARTAAAAAAYAEYMGGLTRSATDG